MAIAGAMMRLVTAGWAARMVHTAAELGIADHVDGPRDASFLAAATSSHPPSLARLLRALAAIGVLHETDDRTYTLTPLGATLRRGVPGSMRAWVLLAFGDEQGKAWEALTHAARTGEHAYRHLFGSDIWTRLAQRPEAARLFDEAMQSLTQGVNGALIAHYPFERYGSIVDVGGGNGSLLMPVLARHPDMRASLFDLPHVAQAALGRDLEMLFWALLARADHHLRWSTAGRSSVSRSPTAQLSSSGQSIPSSRRRRHSEFQRT